MEYQEQLMDGFTMQLPTSSFPTFIYYLFAIISLGIGYYSIHKKTTDRDDKFQKFGWIGVAYISILSFCLFIFTSHLYSSTFLLIKETITSHKKEAIVVDPLYNKSYDEENQKYYSALIAVYNDKSANYTDTIESNTQRQTPYKIGQKIKVYYKEGNSYASEKGRNRSIMYFGLFLFIYVFTAGSLVFFPYALGLKKIHKFNLTIVMKSLVYFFIPFVMIGFEALLITAMIDYITNKANFSFGGFLFLLFFILGLGIGIYGYINYYFLMSKKVKK